MAVTLFQHPEWSRDDRANTKQFFASPTGQRVVEILIKSRPSIEGATRDEIADSGIKAQTWEDCVNALAQLSTLEPPNEIKDDFEQVDDSKYGNAVVNRK